MHGPTNIKSCSTYYTVLSVFPFKLNFIIEGFNECTTIYSQKKTLLTKAVGNGNIRVLNMFIK